MAQAIEAQAARCALLFRWPGRMPMCGIGPVGGCCRNAPAQPASVAQFEVALGMVPCEFAEVGDRKNI